MSYAASSFVLWIISIISHRQLQRFSRLGSLGFFIFRVSTTTYVGVEESPQFIKIRINRHGAFDGSVFTSKRTERNPMCGNRDIRRWQANFLSAICHLQGVHRSTVILDIPFSWGWVGESGNPLGYLIPHTKAFFGVLTSRKVNNLPVLIYESIYQLIEYWPFLYWYRAVKDRNQDAKLNMMSRLGRVVAD